MTLNRLELTIKTKMKNKRSLSLLFLVPFLLFLHGCARTPESKALRQVRDAIQLFIQTGVPTERTISLLEEGTKELRDPFLEETLALFYIGQQPTPQWEKAKPHLEASKTKFASIVLGEIAMRKKQWGDGVKYLKGEDPLSLFLSAYAYSKMGQVDKAKGDLKKAKINKEPIPLPLIFSALRNAQPLPAVNLRYYSLKWVWDNLGKMGEEIVAKIGEKETLREIARFLIDYSCVEPEYTACLSLLSWAVNEKEREVVYKGKDEFSRWAEQLESETIGGLYRLIRLLGVIVIGGILLVLTGIIMSMIGLIKGRGHPLWRRGVILAGSGFGLWIILMLLFHPLPAGGLVQGYIARKFYRKQMELLKQHWQKLDKELISIQGR